MKYTDLCGSERQLWVAPLVLLGLIALPAGCSSEKTTSGTATPIANQVNPFEISIIPIQEDRRNVVVKIVAQDKTAWEQASDTERELDWATVLSLRWISADEENVKATGPGIAGRYLVEGNTLSFQPAFPLVEGQRYIARFDPRLILSESTEASVISSEYRVPAPSAVEPPRLVDIFPSGNRLPANHLKFYLLFNEPMQQGDIFDHFLLEDITTGQQVGSPLRNIELWSHDGRRLTLWFHPGRQKEGVNLNVELGPILQKGHHYELSIKDGWLSQSGQRLKAGVIKRFRAGPAAMDQLNHLKWVISPPQAGSMDPLLCEFHQPLDWALLHSEVHVEFGSGNRIAGHVETGQEESSIRFFPQTPWQAGKYQLVVGSVLEDLAGNSLQRPFAVDLTALPPAGVAHFVHLEFDVSSPSSAR